MSDLDAFAARAMGTSLDALLMDERRTSRARRFLRRRTHDLTERRSR
ncbi:hypothetical protein [Georgenia alba]|uniref:Uncharacterized protein n=1 Tax=Georgenia alba TaxID=2233858 RepID=A0ABW2Q391_9MICO